MTGRPLVPLSIVFCGDSAAQPIAYAAAVQRHVQGMGPTATTTTPISIAAMDVVPATLIVQSDVAVICFSPCHPCTFVNATERWAPLFSHLRQQVRVLLLATEFHCLGSVTAQTALATAGVEPVDWQDVLAAVGSIDVAVDPVDVSFAACTSLAPLMSWLCREDAGWSQQWEEQGQPSTTGSLRYVADIVSGKYHGPDASTTMHGGPSDADTIRLPAIEEAVLQWQKLHDDVAVDMQERMRLPEWLAVSSSIGGTRSRDVHHGGAPTTVYVSRLSGLLVRSMPPELALREASDEVPYIQNTVHKLTECPLEPYVVRKAVADADRRRAADRSSRRTSVADPLIRKYEVRDSLTNNIRQLERRRDSLLKVREDTALRRSYTVELQGQIAGLRHAIASESCEVEKHLNRKRQLLLREKELEDEQSAFERMTTEIAQLPERKQSAADLYLKRWESNKGYRAERDRILAAVQEVEDEIAAERRVVLEVERQCALLCSRMDAHVREMNRAQNDELDLEAKKARLTLALRRRLEGEMVVGERSREAAEFHPERVSDAVATVYGDVAVGPVPAALCSIYRIRSLVAQVASEMVLLIDVRLAPLALRLVQRAAEAATGTALLHSTRMDHPRQTSPHLPAAAVSLSPVVDLETNLRLVCHVDELHDRVSLLLQWVDTIGDEAGATGRLLSKKLMSL